MLDSISVRVRSANPALLAQRLPGKVVIRCRLAADGRITGPKIVENSIDDECGEIFLKGVLSRSPYAPWPEDLHRNLGSDYRDLLLTIFLQ